MSLEKARQIAEEIASNDEEYDFVGEVGVMCLNTGEGREEFDAIQASQCCGIENGTIEVDGLDYAYTFDYGH